MRISECSADPNAMLGAWVLLPQRRSALHSGICVDVCDRGVRARKLAWCEHPAAGSPFPVRRRARVSLGGVERIAAIAYGICGRAESLTCGAD
jgi:hypothetical protein